MISAVYSGLTATALLTVTDAQLVSILMSTSSATIAKGETYQFTATGTFTDNKDYDVTSSAVWNSSDKLVSTVSDYVTFLKALINGGSWNGVRLLRPETLALMRTNQLAPGIGVRFPMWEMSKTVFGLGFAIKLAPGPDEPPSATDEYRKK